MFNQIYEFATAVKAINTHTHHYQDDFFRTINLNNLLTQSYIAWCGVEPGKNSETREYYLSQVKFKNYFVSLQTALKKIYNIDEDLAPHNWEYYSQNIVGAHKDGNWHKTLLANQCNYEKSILDAYWNPGSDNNDPQMFAATFRIDSLFFGFDRQRVDNNGINASQLYGIESNSIDEYIEFVRELIASKIAGGCISLKSAMAYERNINFKKTTKQKAGKVFKDKNYTSDDVTAFQDYFFFEVCKIAAELDIPIQCHTGLGCLDGTRAIEMREIIVANPDTKFVLFHAGFPWCDDILAFLHDCKNVYSDICWLPLLSPTTAEQTLHKLIEVGTSDKITWGCDTWTGEESYGARITMNKVLASVLSAKAERGYCSKNGAEEIVTNILYSNAKSLYEI